MMAYTCAVVVGLSWILGAGNGVGEPFMGEFVDTVDGDTFLLKTAASTITIHIAGVDAPEPAQAFGPEARKHLAELLKGKTVVVTPKSKEKDRVNAMVTLENGVNVGQCVLADGTAWYNDNEDPHNSESRSLMAHAMAAKKGLWADKTPLAPWDFRHDKVAKVATEKPAASTQPPEASPIIYIAGNSPEYHKETCNRMDRSKKPVSLTEAVSRKYTACTECFPPKLPSDAPVIAKKGDYPDMPRTIFPKIKDNPIYQQAQPSWYKDANGNVAGITAQNIASLPFAGVLGFQDGDVLQSINGDIIDSEEKIMQLVDKYKNATSIDVGVLRNGTKQTMKVPIPKF
jgi:endonuclease YncB( thermonuclease family)